MSKNDMVAFPRELSDELAELIADRARVCGGGAFEIWEAIVEGFGTPYDDHKDIAIHALNGLIESRKQISEQRQVDPVVLPERQPDDHFSEKLRDKAEGWNACLDEIAKLGPLYSRPVHGEQMAWLRGELDKALEFVERLRDERETLRADLAETQRISHGEELRANRYSAQVVERDALLYRMAYYLSPALTSHQQWMSKETMHDALSALHEWRKIQGCSASAEPSAMAERIKSAACHECASKPCMCKEPSAPVEIEALRKDAERYRWLRDKAGASYGTMVGDDRETSAEKDASVDEGMALTIIEAKQ